jgi:hypothetical protein
LIRKKFIKSINYVKKGRFTVYTLFDIMKPPKEFELPETQEPSPIETKSEEAELDKHGINYYDIGAAIERLIENKNRVIDRLNVEIKQLKLESMDKDGMIQERDRHISEQGRKIHELNEQMRKRTGGTIKLDELQDIMKGN